jgi:hypothetical protein
MRYIIGDHIRTKTVGEEETMVVNTDTGNYYVLDDVSAFLWKQIEAGATSEAELLERLLEEYETSPEECRKNIENFCRYMVEEKVLHPRPA